MLFNADEVKLQMEKVVSFYQNRLDGLFATRARPALLDKVSVECYGSDMNIKQVAMVGVIDNFSLSVTPYDNNNEKFIIKAIQEANLGVSCSTRNGSIVITIPSVTYERRKEIVKLAKEYGEDAKVAVRNVRRDEIKNLSKAEMSEDLKKSNEKKLQDLTDICTKKIDDLFKAKEQEILKM